MINQSSFEINSINIKSIFKDHVSSSAFKKIDDEIRIIGKFGQISLLDDIFDIWFVSNPPLSTRKLSALLAKIPQNITFTRLDTEAYIQTQDFNAVLKLLPICSIRRRKKLSEIEKKRLTNQLRGGNYE